MRKSSKISNGVKKLIFTIFILGLIFFSFKFVLAEERTLVEVNFFFSKLCPHCAEERMFLEGLEKKYSEIKVNKLGTHEKENIDLLKKLYQEYKVSPREQGLVPVTFIKDKYFLGFDEKIGQDIENYILELIKEVPPEPKPPSEEKPEGKISLPFIGEINISKFPPLVLAIVLGTLDGFNVCSLGALILILGLVLALRSRIKIFIFGGIFIFTTAIIYGFLIILWHQLFSVFAPYERVMGILIGILGIGGGIYFLRQFLKFRKYGPTCEAETGKGITSQFSSKIQELLKKPGNILFTIGSILLFAAIITVVEFPCSAIVPVAFAGILAQSQLPTFQYLFYIAIFVLFYMLDEIIIFLIAVSKMTTWLTSPRFVTWITLIEAILLFLLGGYYIFGL